MTTFTQKHLAETIQICELLAIDQFDACEKCVRQLVELRERSGRLFILGVGGSAANASHAVNDFRKLCGIEAYAPTDNVSEITARTNDEGWENSFHAWLVGSHLSAKDAIMVFSVGGGDVKRNVSMNIVLALHLAHDVGARIIGIVGRDGGRTAEVAHACVIIPTVNPSSVTPHSEAFQAVIWHLFVSHPALKVNPTKW